MPEESISGKLIVVIPAYHPYDRLAELVSKMLSLLNTRFIIADDESKPEVKRIFEKLETDYACDALRQS
ncbi:MAG: hypothetical protein LBU32_17150 [Clostridiales bacterium]|nr:hypothetical protein [Clostridiales bacterium]